MSKTHLETDSSFLPRLRSGDAEAFAQLVTGLHGPLIALARTFTRSHPLAEDIVQETWIAVIRGLHLFEGRSSLRTWIYSILVKRARTMTAREARRADSPFASPGANGGSPSVEWEPGKGRVGLWEGTPVPWDLEDPAAVLQSQEALEVIRETLEAMPPRQRQVILLRDVEDLPPAEVCNVLHLSETNLRVLLHRARARVRRALDRYVRDGSTVRGKSRAGAFVTTSNDGAAS